MHLHTQTVICLNGTHSFTVLLPGAKLGIKIIILDDCGTIIAKNKRKALPDVAGVG